MEEILEKLNLITDKMDSLEERIGQMEQKLQKKPKIIKSKKIKDINNVHIFPFDEASDFVKISLIDGDAKTNDVYPVIELMRMDFNKLAKLMINSEILSVQWSDFTTSESLAKIENNQMVLCS